MLSMNSYDIHLTAFREEEEEEEEEEREDLIMDKTNTGRGPLTELSSQAEEVWLKYIYKEMESVVCPAGWLDSIVGPQLADRAFQ